MHSVTTGEVVFVIEVQGQFREACSSCCLLAVSWEELLKRGRACLVSCIRQVYVQCTEFAFREGCLLLVFVLLFTGCAGLTKQ